jgi:hypothetical protein
MFNDDEKLNVLIPKMVIFKTPFFGFGPQQDCAADLSDPDATVLFSIR